MTTQALFSYEHWTHLLDQSYLMASAAEVHGLIAGLLSGGASADGAQMLPVLYDFLNDGQALSPEAQDEISQLIQQTLAGLAQSDYSFALLLPEDDETLASRLEAMVEWVQSFLVGFAIKQAELTMCSADVKEAVQQLSEMTHIDPHALDDSSPEDNEESYFLVLEHIRLMVLTCFHEIVPQVTQTDSQPKTLH